MSFCVITIPANIAARMFPEKNLNLDHVLPRDKGGKTRWDNIVTSLHQMQHAQGQPASS